MKTAVQPAHITQKTITTRTLPDSNPAARQQAPDFWEYIEALTEDQWNNHSVYLYRTDPRASNYGDGQSNLEKFVGYIPMPDGSQVQFNDREEIERAIQLKYGGKAFRFILKRGHERVTEGKCSNDAPPKYPHVQTSTTGVTVNPVNMSDASATADVAKAAMSAVAGQERASMSIAVDAVRSAAEMVTRLSKPDANPTPQNDVMNQLMVVMLQRAMADPFEQMAKFFALMNQFKGPQGADPSLPPGSPLNRVMDLALERLLNPVSTVAPVSASAELVRSLPMVAERAVEGIREWRIGAEAQRDTAALVANGGRPGVAPAAPGKALPGVNPAQPRPIIVPTQNNQPPQTQESANVGGPPLEFIETKILEIFQENTSAEEAADACLEFLDRIDQKTVATLAGLGEAGLMQLFNVRPILRPATANIPRLTEFIRAFLKFANESMMNPASTPPAMMPPAEA